MAKRTDRENVVINVLRSLPALQANLNIAKLRVEIIQKALAHLTKEEKEITYRLIINGENPFDVAYEMGYEKHAFYNKRKSAMEKIEIALFGKQIECLFNEGGEE